MLNILYMYIYTIGLLSILIKPYLLGMVPDMMIFPVSISYEKTLEEDLFARELMGVPKPKETLLVSTCTCKFMAFTIYQTNKQANKLINWLAILHNQKIN